MEPSRYFTCFLCEKIISTQGPLTNIVSFIAASQFYLCLLGILVVSNFYFCYPCFSCISNSKTLYDLFIHSGQVVFVLPCMKSISSSSGQAFVQSRTNTAHKHGRTERGKRGLSKCSLYVGMDNRRAACQDLAVVLCMYEQQTRCSKANRGSGSYCLDSCGVVFSVAEPRCHTSSARVKLFGLRLGMKSNNK